MRHRVAEWFIPDVSRQRHKSQKAHEPRGLETSDTNNPATQRHIPDERPQLQELLVNKQTNKIDYPPIFVSTLKSFRATFFPRTLQPSSVTELQLNHKTIPLVNTVTASTSG